MQTKDRHCLDAIIEAIDRIQIYSADFDNADDFNDDHRNFDACMMNFIVIGEMVEKLSSDFKNSHSHIDWKKIKGFRNIVAHDYFGIDAEEVWQVIREKLPDLRVDIAKIIIS
jgi:uncharacterized protein with HEPN domain